MSSRKLSSTLHTLAKTEYLLNFPQDVLCDAQETVAVVAVDW